MIRLEPNSYFGFELQEPTRVERISFKATPVSVYQHLRLEVSNNGTDWTSLESKEDKEVLQASANQTVKFVRMISTAAETIEARIEQFIVNVK